MCALAHISRSLSLSVSVVTMHWHLFVAIGVISMYVFTLPIHCLLPYNNILLKFVVDSVFLFHIDILKCCRCATGFKLHRTVLHFFWPGCGTHDSKMDCETEVQSRMRQSMLAGVHMSCLHQSRDNSSSRMRPEDFTSLGGFISHSRST